MRVKSPSEIYQVLISFSVLNSMYFAQSSYLFGLGWEQKIHRYRRLKFDWNQFENNDTRFRNIRCSRMYSQNVKHQKAICADHKSSMNNLIYHSQTLPSLSYVEWKWKISLYHSLCSFAADIYPSIDLSIHIIHIDSLHRQNYYVIHSEWTWISVSIN